jgi:hypothetical protein
MESDVIIILCGLPPGGASGHGESGRELVLDVPGRWLNG